MSKKIDHLLNYIKNLEVGTKISMRSLSEHLEVSEGTAYKAIKKAEEIGYVRTKPRAGTIRIDSDQTDSASHLSFSQLAAAYGLSVLIASEENPQLSSFVIGDGSLEQLQKDFKKVSGTTICIIGDRPDIQSKALSLGMHLIITNGIQPNASIQAMAIQKQRYLFISEQTTANLVQLMLQEHSDKMNISSYASVHNWMRPPKHLYYNDIVSDWFKVYYDIFKLNAQYAVINDDLNICGLLDANDVMNATPMDKISNLYTTETPLSHYTISSNATMHNVISQMLQKNTELFYVVEDGKMRGVVTALDALRFYKHGNEQIFSAITLTPDSAFHQNAQTKKYLVEHLRCTDVCDTDTKKALLSEAAKLHLKSTFQKNCVLDQDTFYNIARLLNEETIYVLSSLIKADNSECLLETGLYSQNDVCLAKSTALYKFKH